MPRAACCLVFAALVCSALSRGSSLGCDLSSSASLTSCVRNIIESSRPALKRKFDPIHVKNQAGGDKSFKWSVKDVYINGLSAFSIGKLYVHAEGTKIKVNMHVSWPKIVGRAKAHVNKCIKIFFHRQCFKAHGHAKVSLIQPAVRLSTTLLLSMAGATPAVKPSKTDIKVSLPGINVEPKLAGTIGKILGLLRQPVRHFVNKFTKKFWRENKGKIQKQMELKFNELVTVHLSRKLPAVLTGFSGLNFGLQDDGFFSS